MNFSNLSNISKYLSNKPIEETGFWCEKKYSVKWLQTTNPNVKYLRIDKLEPGLFGTSIWANSNSVAGIDLVVNKESNTVDIPWWMVNDSEFVKMVGRPMYGQPVNIDESNELKNLLFEYAKNYAHSNKCNTLKRDVHNNLREFNADIKKFGFELTGKRAHDNPYWLVTTKLI